MAVESTSLAPASSPFSAADPGPDTCVAGHREPAPFNDPELVHPGDPRAEIEKLGDRIAELSARIQAATYELLVLIRQFDERGGWSGFTSCAHWLSWRAGLAPGAAREHVRVARALADLPKLSDAMRRGVVSYSKMRAVTRVATPETEQTLPWRWLGPRRTWNRWCAPGGGWIGRRKRWTTGGVMPAERWIPGWTMTEWWWFGGG